MAFYILLGATMGIAAALITRLVYFTEDAFERLPIHWMWWPLIGGAAVGICGLLRAAHAWRRLRKYLRHFVERLADQSGRHFVRREIDLLDHRHQQRHLRRNHGAVVHHRRRAGTGFGIALAHAIVPAAAIDLKVAGLVGMAAMFAGASRAFLACTVFAFEATMQPYACCRCWPAARPATWRPRW